MWYLDWFLLYKLFLKRASMLKLSGALPKHPGWNSRSTIIVPHVGVSGLWNYFDSNCLSRGAYACKLETEEMLTELQY